MSFLIIILIVSFFLEGLFSLVVSSQSFFLPLFTVVALVSIFPYFNKYDSLFWKFCIVIGLCYDVIYTNTVFIHAFLFLVLGYFISFLYLMLFPKIWNYLWILVLAIIGYRMISFLLLVGMGYISFSISRLGYSIIFSICSNIIYGLFLYGGLVLLRKYKKIILHY